jgi:hypothetical protein
MMELKSTKIDRHKLDIYYLQKSLLILLSEILLNTKHISISTDIICFIFNNIQ